jgi:hypothetical protein
LASALFTVLDWSVQTCRPISTVGLTAGHNALRGQVPGQRPAFEMRWHKHVRGGSGYLDRESGEISGALQLVGYRGLRSPPLRGGGGPVGNPRVGICRSCCSPILGLIGEVERIGSHSVKRTVWLSGWCWACGTGLRSSSAASALTHTGGRPCSLKTAVDHEASGSLRTGILDAADRLPRHRMR